MNTEELNKLRQENAAKLDALAGITCPAVAAFDALIVAVDELADDRCYGMASELDSPYSPDFDRIVEAMRHNEALRLLKSFQSQLDAEIEAATFDKENHT